MSMRLPTAVFRSGNRSISVRWPSISRFRASLEHCVDFPALSSPSTTMNKPRSALSSAALCVGGFDAIFLVVVGGLEGYINRCVNAWTKLEWEGATSPSLVVNLNLQTSFQVCCEDEFKLSRRGL